MSEVLKIASTIIRCISSWLGCPKCLEDIPSEKIVVHEETCNKTNNGKLFIIFYAIYFNTVLIPYNIKIFHIALRKG